MESSDAIIYIDGVFVNATVIGGVAEAEKL